jgi:hypothetical protein
MKAIVNYHFAGERNHAQLGEIDIEPLLPGSPLTMGCRVMFGVGGNTKFGTVEAILPSATGSPIPAVTLRLSKPVH